MSSILKFKVLFYFMLMILSVILVKSNLVGESDDAEGKDTISQPAEYESEIETKLPPLKRRNAFTEEEIERILEKLRKDEI